MRCRLSMTSVVAGIAALLLVLPLALSAQEKPAPSHPDRDDAAATAQGRWTYHFGPWRAPSTLTFDAMELRLGLDADPLLGIVTSPVNDLLRSQLKLPEHQGLVVTLVSPGGPAAKAGIQVHDILLSAGGQPLASASSLRKAMRTAQGKEKEIGIELMRSGERMEVAVKAEAMERSGAPLSGLRSWRAERRGPQYRIGVGVADVDSTLGDQLHLEEGQGVVVTEVMPDSPAAKAGIEQHDVLLRVNKTPLAGAEDLRRAVVESGGKELKIELLREGQRQTISVKPEKQPAELYFSWPPFVEMEIPGAGVPQPWIEGLDRSSRSLHSQLERMSKQIESLRRKVDSLRSGEPEEPPEKPAKKSKRKEPPAKPAEGSKV